MAFLLGTVEIFDPSSSADGASCTVGSNCTSGFCSGGVCCDTACTGSCTTCTATGSMGTCSAIAAGAVGTPACAPFLCNGSQSCPTTCVSNTECVSGRVCHDGTCTFAATPVSWQGGANVNASGGSLTRQSSCGTWDSGAYSAQTVSGEGYVEALVNETNTGRMVGLSTGNWSPDFTHLAFGIYLGADAHVYVYESGVFIGQFGTYSTGDRVDVAVVGGAVVYRKNGVVLYNQREPAAAAVDRRRGALRLRGDAGQRHHRRHAQRGPAAVEPVTWSSSLDALASGNDLSCLDCSTWGHATGVSAQELASGDGYVEFTVTNTTSIRMAGLGVAPWTPVVGSPSIRYALELAGGSGLSVWESGAFVTTVPGYAAGDILRVGVENGQVVYRKNGALLYRSKSGPAVYPLQMQADLYNGGLNGRDVRGGRTRRGPSPGGRAPGSR